MHEQIFHLKNKKKQVGNNTQQILIRTLQKKKDVVEITEKKLNSKQDKTEKVTRKRYTEIYRKYTRVIQKHGFRNNYYI